MQLHQGVIQFVFDGSWVGLLSSVFEAFERKTHQIELISTDNYVKDMFSTPIFIVSDTVKAERVWKGLKKKIEASSQKEFFQTYLSEQSDAHQHLLNYAIYVFENKINVSKNYGHPSVIALQQYSKSVSRESHRMKAFIRFEKWKDGTFFTSVTPDFNVLPLIIKHFRNRYTDQKWIIYDSKRSYGIYYDLKSVSEVNFDEIDIQYQQQESLPSIGTDALQSKYELLWKDYFKSTNIKERKNLKLHIQHVPKRYWKYLTEIDTP